MGVRFNPALELRRHLLFKTNHPSEEAFKVKERGTYSAKGKRVLKMELHEATYKAHGFVGLIIIMAFRAQWNAPL